MFKVLKKVLKIFISLIVSIICLLTICVVILNIAKYPYYKDYRNEMKREIKIPGLNDNFIPQSMTYIESKECYLACGYEKKTNNAILYRIDKDGSNTKIYVVNDDSTKFIGHFGGITSYEDYVWVVDDYKTNDYDISNSVFVFNLNKLLDAKNNSHITIGKQYKIEPEGSCIYYSNGYLYIGEFYKEGKYDTADTHEFVTPNKEHNKALVCAYKVNEELESGFNNEIEYAISVPDLVQAYVVMDDVVAISTSWGLNSSYIGFYSVLDSNSTIKLDNKDVKLYYIDSNTCISNVKAPPMSEGMIIKDNRLYILYESASNKYYFGKLLGQTKIESIPYRTE